jgi:plastocyanin
VIEPQIATIGPKFRRPGAGLTWLRLMSGAAILEAALLLITGVSLGDSETLAFGVLVTATTAWFILRPSRIPVLIRSLVFLDVLFFMATATIANLTTQEGLGAVVLPLVLAVTSATGLVATTGYLVRGTDPVADQSGPALVVIVALAICVAAIGVTLDRGSGGTQAQGGDLQLTAHSAKFSTTTLSAASGHVAIDATNNDLFWHTVTIDKLGVDARMPVKGHRRITFTAAPGTYTFYCAIPGHASIGMKGTLEVR